MKTAFFDRDGTIIKDYPDEEWREITAPEFQPGVKETLKHVQDQGYMIIIITNQYLIGEGFIRASQYYDISDQMLEELQQEGIEITDIFFCPDARWEKTNRLKPATTMVDYALEKYPEIDLSGSFMIGDSITDMEMAKNVGVKGYGIGLAPNEDLLFTPLDDILELTKHV
ncbi:D-glycero-alpha-D-manno-heptose-1,7-bisphosphate 7-phosphatase [Salsuginibacillus kocurii]|uniref:D-glycero-alpha-D-manno-heptose-1,7-bisphosphate 7-phosphatase n=1 Tax=Salsuginibacillus kocurii TaxID=427078 RepID=UPI00036C087C|nr:HAD-IIIA family hydrolase [Salsuginibacillus kocurii]